MLGIVGGLCDLRLVCIGLYCWLYDGDELAARDELCDHGRRGCQGAGEAPHSPGGVGTDLLELLASTADLFWIRLRGMLRAGLERAVLRLVAISKELRCVRLLQGRVSNRDSAHIRPAVLLTSSSARPPRHDEQMPMECGCGSRDIKNCRGCGGGTGYAKGHWYMAGGNACAPAGDMPQRSMEERLAGALLGTSATAQ